MLAKSKKRHSRIFATLSLLALLMLQMSWAGHESQHAVEDLAEPCFVCVQLDSSGSLPPTLVLSNVEPAHQLIANWQSVAPIGEFRFNAHAPRAPPGI